MMARHFSVDPMPPAPVPEEPAHWRDCCPVACRLLWAAVLMEMIEAATAPDRFTAAAIASRNDARAWIGSADFHAVCTLAGIEPEPVLTRLRAVIASGGRVGRFYDRTRV